jgi:hypothetical protein
VKAKREAAKPDPAEALRREIASAEIEAREAEDRASELRGRLDRIEKARKEEERRKRYGDGKRSLANHLAREVTGGDISWLPYDEQERWNRIAELATDYIADHAEDKP